MMCVSLGWVISRRGGAVKVDGSLLVRTAVTLAIITVMMANTPACALHAGAQKKNNIQVTGKYGICSCHLVKLSAQAVLPWQL